MDNSRITSEKFITLSREYVDDVMGDREIKIKKEHYYIFAISNFIATKEYFLKKNNKNNKNEETTVTFDRDVNENILPMVIAFYSNIKSRNKDLKEPTIYKMKEKIIISPDDNFTDPDTQEKVYPSLYLFNKIRNSLSHAGNYEIIEDNGEHIVAIKNITSSTVYVPLELFDFIAFYVNSYIDKTDSDNILSNYLIYKESKDNKKYYNFEGKDAVNKIANLLSKVEIQIKQKNQTMTRNRSGATTENYIDEVIDEIIYNYGERASEILDKINRANLSDEQKLELLLQINITFKANKRLASVKIDKCIENIESILKLDRKSASLYSHSIILFTNREEVKNTNDKGILENVGRIIKDDFLSINIPSLEYLDNQGKKKMVEKYKQAIEKILEKIPDLIRVKEHRYRNSIFHNNVEFKNDEIHFWNQKDNTNPNDIHTFHIHEKPQLYNSELKKIENHNNNVGDMTVSELYNILNQYSNEIAGVDEMMNKLWTINQFDNGLLKWDMSIYSLLDNLNRKIKELSPETR